jgi:activator of 2-hydroxyglutaryl-CoA dehydratase
MRGYIGVDVGSVSTNLVLIGDDDVFIDSIYLRTRGNPIEAVKDVEDEALRVRSAWGRRYWKR